MVEHFLSYMQYFLIDFFFFNSLIDIVTKTHNMKKKNENSNTKRGHRQMQTQIRIQCALHELPTSRNLYRMQLKKVYRERLGTVFIYLFYYSIVRRREI